MSLTNNHQVCVTRMFFRVLNKDILSMEMQMKLACMICDDGSSITNEVREQACLILALAIENDQPMSNVVISFLNESASQQLNRYNSRLQQYVVCANVASYPRYFLSETIFKNFRSLLEETNNIQIRNWVIWAFSTRVKYGLLSNLEMKLLQEYLCHPDVSWSISYIIRKITERYDEKVSKEVWCQLIKIINSNKYDIGTYNNVVYALSNLFSSKYSSIVSSACKQHVQYWIKDIIITESLSKDILSNAIRVLKSMVINGYTISKEISLKLKELSEDSHPYLSENVKTVLDLLNDDTNELHQVTILKQPNFSVRTEKIAAMKTVLIERSLEKTDEPQSKFVDLEMMIDTYDNKNNSNRCESNMEQHPHIQLRPDRLSFLHNTYDEVQNLLKSATNGHHLVPKEINYLLEKFSDDEKHFTGFSGKKRNEIYELIASTFQQLVKHGQQQPDAVLEHLIKHLPDSSNLARFCSNILLEIVKQDQIIPDDILKQIEEILSKINDPLIRKTTLDILAISIERGKNDLNKFLDLKTLEDDLLRATTSLPTSYIFSRAVLLEKTISTKAFKNLCYVVVNQGKNVYHIDARRRCMKAICYSIKRMDERKSLLPTIQFCLIKALKDPDDQIRSLALQTLYFYCEVESITHIHPSILNDSVYHILINTQSSQQLQNLTSLYLKAASKKYLLLKEVIIAISDLLTIIPDFTVRQNASWTLKYISKESRTIVLPPAVITNIEIALDDPEFDIRTTAAHVFLLNWKKNPIYFLRISQASIIKLLTNQFNIEIQKDALSILKKTVEQKQQLSNDLMEIIALFLFQPDMTIVTLVIDILFHYVKYHTLTQNIVHYIERALQNQQNQEKLIIVLRKCTFHQSILTEKTLIILGDLLLKSTEETTINHIISTLEFADRNQILPEMINDLLKYEYYVKVLIHSECEEEIKYAEQQLIDATSNGKQLSKNILSSLQQLLYNPKRKTSILKIIVNITSNSQNLNNDMMKILSDLSSQTTTANPIDLIQIFLNVIGNNQTPPDTFLIHLQNFIGDTTINTNVILIYTILLERSANVLNTDVIGLIYQLLESVTELKLELKRNLSTFVKLAIESGIAPPKPEFITALLNEKDLLIRNNTIQMIDYLVTMKQYILDDNILVSLSQISFDRKVLRIFESASEIQQLPTDISERLALIHCQNLHQDINLIKQLESAVSQGQLLLEQHFSELSNLLYSSSEEHRILASQILRTINSSNQTIPYQVIEAVVATLKDKSIQLNTLQLLDKVVQRGWTISEKTIADLTDLATQSSINIDVKTIARNILNHQNRTDFLMIEKYLYETTTSQNEQIEKLIEDHKMKIPMDIFPLLHDKLTNKPTTATEFKILKVLQCAVYNRQSLSNELLDYLSNDLAQDNQVTGFSTVFRGGRGKIFADSQAQTVCQKTTDKKLSVEAHQTILEHLFKFFADKTSKVMGTSPPHPPLHRERCQVICATILDKAMENGQILSDGIVHTIEKSFLINYTQPILNLIRKLARQYVLFQDNTIKLLIEKSENDANATSIIEIIAEYQQLPSAIIVPFLSKNLSSNDLSKVRSSFIILRYQILKNYIEQPIDLLKKVTLSSKINLNKLVMEISSIDEYLNIVHTLLSVEYSDENIFEIYPVKQWSRECLCFDLLARMDVNKNPTEVYEFYHNLSKLEESKGYELYDQVRDDILRFLIEKHTEINLNKINQILLLLQDVSIDALSSNDSNWYENLIKYYIREQVIQRFLQSKYSSTIVNYLIDILLDTYQIYQSVELLISILDFYSEPNQLIMFLRRISDHKVTNEELNEILFLSKKTKTTLDKQLDMKIIKKKLYQIWKSLLNDLNKADELLRKLSTYWSFSNLCSIVDCIDMTLTNFIQCLNMINDYRVNDTLADDIIYLFRTQQSDVYTSKMYSLIINNCFPRSNTVEKPIQQLIEEILENNRNNQSVLQMTNKNRLQKMLVSCQVISTRKSLLIDTITTIESWTKEDIQKWSKQVQSNTEWAKTRDNLLEIIAVIQRAVYLDSNYKVRHIQLMAVLLLINTNQVKRGRLAEIATGEGKSTIISMLTIIKALQGLHVDIVTSSTTLAQRDAEGKTKLYEMFNLSVSHNGDDNTIYTSGPKKCYKSSIVYGDVSHFQFDILRDEFSLLNTRDKRPFDVVIIDEVDSMLIDDNNKIARLADYILGMEYLNPLLNAIWLAVNNPQVQETIDKRAIIHNIKTLILDKNAQITVPQHFRPFVFSQLSIWINNALLARDVYRLDHHYLIKSDEKNISRITPIDYSNTGVIQSSTTWSDGLHQFLQLKHGLKLTPLNLTTNFLSNLGFFHRYEKNVYGLTGTLGSNEAKQLLCDVYSVDTIAIPKYKPICHIELPSVILNGEKQWIEAIVQSSLTEVKRNRSVLIICETRINAKTIVKQLRQHDFKGIVKLYTDNTDTNESNIAHTKANSGDIIVATNLAGRGTDLKTSKEVEVNGGLHVCLTFMPINFRVEQQAFGRTSRQGNRGTSQLILNTGIILPRLSSLYPKFIEEHPELSIDDLQTIKYLRDWREQTEAIQLNEIRTRDIPEIKANDKLFQKFCHLLADLRKKDKDEYKLNSVKERWGLWLKDKDHRNQVKLSLLENVKMAGFRFLDHNPNSLYHAVNQQLRQNITDEELKTQMIKHIISNQTCYEDFFQNFDNNACILYIEETMIKALMRSLNINIVLFTSYEDSITVYKRQGAIETIYLAGDFDHSYYSLAVIDEKTTLNYVSVCEYEDNTPVKMMTGRNRLNMQLYEKLNLIFGQQNHLEKYAQFEQTIRNQYEEENKIIQNPFYLIAKADMLIGKTQQLSTRVKHAVRQITSFRTKEFIERKKARQCLDAAIQLDPIYSFTARVSRAYLLIEEQTDGYKQKAKEDLITARDQIKNFILPGLHSMQLNLYKNNEVYDDLSKQLSIKIDIIQLYNTHIENAISAIEDSQKLVDVIISNRENIITKRKLQKQKALDVIMNPSKSIDEWDTEFMGTKITYKLIFRNLSVHKDIIVKDQCEKLINLMKCDYQHISIQFQQIDKTSAKDIIQSCEKNFHDANLRVDYLNKEEFSKLFDFETSTQVKKNVTMTLKNRQQYEEIIQIRNTAGTINISMEKTRKFWRSNEAVGYLNCKKNEQILSMSVTSMNTKFFKSFIHHMSLDDAVFSLTFNQLSSTDILNLIEFIDKQILMEFTNLNVAQVSAILKTREERDFLICLDNLDDRKAQRILKKFDPDEQDVDIKLNKIADKYLENTKPDDELNELDQHGINKLILINELNPIPWLNVITITSLGAAQIIGGVCLTVFTCGIGVSLGISLITEGVCDLYFALRGAMSRDINWKDYAIQKGISLAICFATLGLSVVSQSARAVQQVGRTTNAQFVKQTLTQMKNLVRTSFSTIGQSALQSTVRNSLSLACKQVAVTSVEMGAREILNYSTDSVLNNHFIAEIKSEVEKYVESSMDEIVDKDLEYRKMIENIFFNDCYNQNHQWQNQIEQIATKILNTSNEYIEAATSFANGASNAFINHFKKIGGTTKSILNVTQKGLNIIEIVPKAVNAIKLTKKFFDAFKDELRKQVQGMPDLIELLSKEQNMGREVAETIFHLLEKHHIFNRDGLINQDSYLEDQNENIIEPSVTNQSIADRQFSGRKLQIALQSIDLNILGRDYQTIVKNFFIRILNDTYQKSILKKKIRTLIVDHLMSFIQGVLFEPLKQYVIGKTVQSLSQEIQRKLDTNNQTIAEKLHCEGAKRYMNIVFNEFVNDIQSGKIQVESNVKEQLQSIAGKPIKDRNEREKFLLSVLDNKAGGIIELGLISAMTGLKFSIIENEESSEEMKQDGTIQLIYIKPQMNDQNQISREGYWKSVGDHNLPDIQGRNGSLYNIIYSQTSDRFTSPEQIRSQLAEFMCRNPTYIERIQPAINIINANANPIYKKTLLMEGGSSIIDQSQIETTLDVFIKSNNDNIGLTIGATIKTLTEWIISNDQEITMSINVAHKLFPKLISLKVASVSVQSITLIKTSANLLDKYQNRDNIGMIQELIRTGDIILTIYKTLKN